MKKSISIGLGSVFALMAVVLGQPAWGQVCNPNTVGCPPPNKVCLASQNPVPCQSCFDEAGDDPQAICECECRFLFSRESKKECMENACGTSNGGIGSKVALGAVFNGEVYAEPALAYQAAYDKRAELGLEDDHTIVVKPFYPVTGNIDSQLFHLLGVPASFEGIADLYEPVIGPNCLTHPESCIIAASNAPCTNGTNQDGGLFTPGCQPARGCKETSPSVWLAQGCSASFGCCNSTSSTWNPITQNCRVTGTTATADPDRGDGQYGGDGAGCPASSDSIGFPNN